MVGKGVRQEKRIQQVAQLRGGTLTMNELEQLLSDIDETTSDNAEKMFGAVAAITDKNVAECAEVHPVAEWYEA